MSARILSKALVFQTFEESSRSESKGDTYLTGKSDFFGAAVSLNAALTDTKLTNYMLNIGKTLMKVVGNLSANAILHGFEMVTWRRITSFIAPAALVTNVVAKIFVIAALVVCLFAACVGLKVAKNIFSEITDAENIVAIGGNAHAYEDAPSHV
jgi:hypothetical protein